MAQNATDAFPPKAAPPSPGGRNLRSSGRTLRSNSEGARLVSLDDIQKKSPAKKKKAEPKEAKKAAEGASGADPKGKGKQAAVPEGGDSDAADEPEDDEDDDPNRTVIVVEHCTQCKSFLRRATDGLEGSQAIDVVVKLNPEKPRRGCFEIRQQGGQTFISLLDMSCPFKPMKDLDMGKVIANIVDGLSCATEVKDRQTIGLSTATEVKDCQTIGVPVKLNPEKSRISEIPSQSRRRVKRPSTDPQLNLSLMFTYGFDTVFEGGQSNTSLAVIPFPMNAADRINSPMEAGMPIGAADLTSIVRGFSFLIGQDFHRVANVRMGFLSNRIEAPFIQDPNHIILEYSFGYDATVSRYKIAEFARTPHAWGHGTRILVHTCGLDEGWRIVHVGIKFNIAFEEAPNVGISVMDGGLSTVSFLGTVNLSNTPIEAVLTFNFSTEEVQIFPTPADVDGYPVLCSLRNELCCSYYDENTLSIFQLRDYTWELIILINSLPNIGAPQDHFPIGIQGTQLLVAYACWLNEEDGIPRIAVDPPNFFNLEHGLLIDIQTGTIQVIDCFRPVRWFFVKTIVESDEALPY